MKHLVWHPYTQPWQDMTTLSTFERLVTPFGRLAYTGRILSIMSIQEVEYMRPEGCPFAVQEGRELSAIISAPRLMKQIYRNGRLWIVTEKIAHMGKAVSLWTISSGKWQYVMELEANYRDITMDVNENDTAIILIKSSNTDGMSLNVRIKSLVMLRLGDAPKLTTIALLSHLNSSNNVGIDDHLCRMLENSSWH
ncbi:hypothetical protein OSTOST_22437 [Ostertagia ostertagi]